MKVCIACESAKFVLTFGISTHAIHRCWWFLPWVLSDGLLVIFAAGPKLGIVPDLGSTWQLPRRLPRGKALPLALLGDPLSAQEAERLGMIWSVVPDGAMVDEAVSVAERLASRPAMTEIRRLMVRMAHCCLIPNISSQAKQHVCGVCADLDI